MPNIRRITLAVCASPILIATLQPAQAQQNTDWRKLAEPFQTVRAEPVFGPLTPQSGEILGFPASNVTLLAWLPLGQFQGSQLHGNDCWGYVSPSGREYAIYGLQSGFTVLDITEPTNPVQIGFVPGNNSVWRDVKVIGHYAYGVSEGGLGIQVIDLSDVDSGVVRHVGNVSHSGHNTTHNIVSNPDSGYLYLCGANIANGGLVAVSTANPEDPTIVGSWRSRYVHDAQVVSYDSGQYAGREIAFCLSGGGGSQTGLRIVDVTNKSNMFTMSTVSWSGARYSHQGWLSEDKRYFYINDELDEGSSVDVTTTRIFDVSNLNNPSFVGTFTTGLASTDHNLYVNGDRLFEANYMSGLRVFDVSDATDPVEIAYFDTSPDRDMAGYHGAWSTFPFFPSGTVLISDIERGLFVLRVGEDRLEFAFPNGLPAMLTPNAPTPVTLDILESGVTLDPATVGLVLQTDSGEVTIPAIPDGDGGFIAEIPASDCFEQFEYWFTASDDQGRTYVEPLNATVTGGFTVQVATGEETPFADDFETDQGWLVDNSNATQGGWTRAIPTGGNPAEPSGDFDGSGHAYVTGADGQWLLGGPVTLTSPVFELADRPFAALHYAIWYDVDGFPAPTMLVDVSNDDGATWTTVETLSADHAWRETELLVADHVTPTDAVRIRFRANNSLGIATVEAAVDGFRLVSPTCDACIADYNNDGTLDTLDFLAYLNDFTGSTQIGDPDLNGDGAVDTLDFLLYLNLYAAGCD